MENLNYGYIKPTAGDESATEFFGYLSDNWERISDHAHNGVDSSLITSSSISKYQLSIDAQKLSFTGLNYAASGSTVDLLISGATAGMYVSCDESLFENYVTGVTGTNIGLSTALTGANADGTIELSHWNHVSSSVFETIKTLPSGYPSATSLFKFYVNTIGDDYYKQEIYPTIVYSETNEVTMRVNENVYDLKMVVY